MSKKIQEKIKEIKEALKAKGLTEDRYGNFKYQDNTKRYKFQSTSLRAEVKSGSGWFRRWSAYYKYIIITEEGKLKPIKLMG